MDVQVYMKYTQPLTQARESQSGFKIYMGAKMLASLEVWQVPGSGGQDEFD